MVNVGDGLERPNLPFPGMIKSASFYLVLIHILDWHLHSLGSGITVERQKNGFCNVGFDSFFFGGTHFTESKRISFFVTQVFNGKHQKNDGILLKLAPLSSCYKLNFSFGKKHVCPINIQKIVELPLWYNFTHSNILNLFKFWVNNGYWNCKRKK